ncbi:MAG: DUF4450 domain-containing protein [Bacteroidota bacterium]
MRILFLPILIMCAFVTKAQVEDTTQYWHGKERVLRYHPEGEDIVITNGNRRFTRALYGTNTAFRAEAGDLPEFALYMPGMGGNIKFGLVSGNKTKWLINADQITARYRAGSMLYDIKDALLGTGKLHIVVLALADAEGVIIKIKTEGIVAPVELVWAYGGATGKKFSRDGDMGPDPESSFYLKPEYCTDNRYTILDGYFKLRYGTGEILSEEDRYENKNLAGERINPQKGKEQFLTGIFPSASAVHIADAAKQNSPAEMFASSSSKTPAIAGKIKVVNNENYFFCFSKTDSSKQISYTALANFFDKAEMARKSIAGRIKVNTPDPYINTIGSALSIAADAIWEAPSYLHGSVGWRMRLNGWRGAYTGDVLGWHDRARLHFREYAQSQVITPASGPIVADTALHLTRQLEKLGTSLFSSGYISRNPGGDLRPHHYDMNLVFIDELLWHFKWTGDIEFIKEMWPVIKRHLAWEKRNFDPDNDGLYDAYASIWASDALQYSGGSVTHSSAYNYRANKMAADLALLIGEDGKPYRDEATKIIESVNHVLWIPGKGIYAEFKDALGLKILHPNAGLWTVYHSIDSELPDAFKAYQTLRYVDADIPHIPIKAKGLPDGYYTLSTSNWMPYSWSLNNVALAELMHTSLANWQAGRNEEAFLLWKSSLLESMYLGGSPGNFQQISTYDAIRGEAYRDFADPVGMTARSLIQGLFGVLPDALNHELTIKPGFPSGWSNASLETPDVKFSFARTGQTDKYTIVPSFQKKMRLKLLLKANAVSISSLLVNGEKVAWNNIDSAIATPMISINMNIAEKYEITIVWKGMKADTAVLQRIYAKGNVLSLRFLNASIQHVYDPQQVLGSININNHVLNAKLIGEVGNRTAFVQLKQGELSWWQPLALNIREPVEIIGDNAQLKNSLQCVIRNNTDHTISGSVEINKDVAGFSVQVTIPPFVSKKINAPADYLIAGSNEVTYTWTEAGQTQMVKQNITSWNINKKPMFPLQPVIIDQYFNDKVTNIFKNQYLSPRPATVTLQLPTQGIGEWTHPMLTAVINDSGFRQRAVKGNLFSIPQGIHFNTPADSTKPNILFTSQWDNYPKEALVPLSGKASHIYLLMAGSTNPMQSRMVNGAVIIDYVDGSADTLLLKNPQTWWPIEQDYFEDGYAFTTNAPRPVRVHLKTGAVISTLDDPGNKYNGKMIEGGAANVLDLPLQKNKALKELRLQTWSNDVVIGLMSVTLAR